MSISGVGGSHVPNMLTQQAGRDSDGDSAAQEGAESPAAKQTETQHGGLAPNSAGLVNKLA